MSITTTEISTFAQIVDKLRTKNEAELKLLYIKLFADELAKEWKAITKNAKMKNVSDEAIVKAVRKVRQSRK
jgi:hypothetical protein